MKIFLHHFNFFISFRQCFLELFRQMTKKRNEQGYQQRECLSSWIAFGTGHSLANLAS